ADAQLRRERPRHAQLDLRVPRSRHPQHPRVRAGLRRGPHDSARAELPLDEHDPPRRQRGHRAQPRAQGEEPLVGARPGRGEAGGVVEVEDEHAEARFVAAEIAALVEEGLSGSEIAVFYRTNAQSRVLEDVLVRQGVAYQVIGGPRFYDRAEIKDAMAYLQAI